MSGKYFLEEKQNNNNTVKGALRSFGEGIQPLDFNIYNIRWDDDANSEMFIINKPYSDENKVPRTGANHKYLFLWFLFLTTMV